MAVAKKEDAAVEAVAHDCKKDCELLHKQIAELKKEVAALQAELKKAPKGGGADPRVDKIIEAILLSSSDFKSSQKLLQSL